MRYWIPTYLKEWPKRRALRAFRKSRILHIIVLVCDHFEPRHGIDRENQDIERLEAWGTGYHKLQLVCKELYGHSPKHTWFYPPHHGIRHLSALAKMAFDGLGEVELHLHHEGDTSESLRALLTDTISKYNRHGILLTASGAPKTSFGFVHGDWALDNSAGGRFCGVNDELTILREVGCWGDFTMPSANESQTRKINSIYYALDNRKKPKSHDRGVDLRNGIASVEEGLFMMQGPLGLNWRAPRHPRIENGSITSMNWGRPDRINVWLDCHVHVSGRPEWLFIKLHTHGAIERDFDAIFGDKAMELHRVLNEKYNDRMNFQLHYVTAREAFNICKAAEAGCEGDPAQYLNYYLPPSATSHYYLSEEHDLGCCTTEHLSISAVGGAKKAELLMKGAGLKKLTGYVNGVDVRENGRDVKIHVRDGRQEILLQYSGSICNVVGGEIVRVNQLEEGNVEATIVPKNQYVTFYIREREYVPEPKANEVEYGTHA